MSTNYFNIALLQILPCSTQSENMKKGIEYCRRAKAGGADLALFPEMWNTGYYIPMSDAEINDCSILPDSDFVIAFSRLAKELDMAIAITFLEKHKPRPRNTVCLFDRNGNNVLSYSKVHTCDFGDEKMLSHGDDFYVADINTAKGNVKIGAMICYDREFPESARILMLKGAEIIIVPNACPMEINRISQLRGRAYENMLGIATCNYPFPHPDCNGHSTAFDGVAYAKHCSGSRDTLIVEAGENEGLYMASFDMELIRQYRKEEVHGNAYRRPEKYDLLINDEKSYPFIRNDFNK